MLFLALLHQIDPVSRMFRAELRTRHFDLLIVIWAAAYELERRQHLAREYDPIRLRTATIHIVTHTDLLVDRCRAYTS